MNIWPLTLPKVTGGLGKILDTVMLIYRHWAVMANSEKLSDKIALGKCEVHYKKSQYSFCIIIACSKLRAITQVLMGLFWPKLIGYQLFMVLIIYTKNESNLINSTEIWFWTDGWNGWTDDAKTISLWLHRG